MDRDKINEFLKTLSPDDMQDGEEMLEELRNFCEKWCERIPIPRFYVSLLTQLYINIIYQAPSVEVGCQTINSAHQSFRFIVDNLYDEISKEKE